MSKYEPTPHKSDGGFSVVGLPILTAGMLAVAVALGWLASWVGQFFYLILFFPLVVGGGLAIAGFVLGKACRMRSIGLSLLIGLLAGVVTMVTMHFFDYTRRTDRYGPPAASMTFTGFMDQQAKDGVTIGSRGGGFNLGYTGTWIYWLVEAGVVTVLSLLGVAGSAAEPFCASCDKWKEQKELGKLNARGGDLKVLIEAGDVEALKEFDPGDPTGDHLIQACVCEGCPHESTVEIKLVHVTTDAKGETSNNELVSMSYPPEALADFEAMFAEGRVGTRKANKTKRVLRDDEELPEDRPAKRRSRDDDEDRGIRKRRRDEE